MCRVSVLCWVRRLFVFLIVALAGAAPLSAESALGGDYAVTGQNPDGRTYSGQLRITTYGQGYAIAWRLDQGGDYRGLGLKVDNVLGAVYRPDKKRVPGLGVVVYRIDGDELKGVWLVEGGQKTGRENLKGSPDLLGDYAITLGENPDNLTNYEGRVHIEKRGDIYRVSWYVPRLAYIGNGVRIGDILVVGYALGEAPGTVGYCVTDKGMTGLWTYGAEEKLGKELLKSEQPAAGTGKSGDCGL